MKQIKNGILIFAFLLVLPTMCFADAGIPMLGIGIQFFLYLLIPVIIIETVIFQRYLKLGYFKSIKVVSLANIASTLLGYPLSWLILFGVELLSIPFAFIVNLIFGDYRHISPILYRILNSIGLILCSSWLPPMMGIENISWLVNIAMIVGLIPAYYVSVYMETKVIEKYFKNDFDTWQNIKPTCRKANQYSYLFLVLVLFIFLFYQFFITPGHTPFLF